MALFTGGQETTCIVITYVLGAMSSEEELRAAISAKGDEIRVVKEAKAPTMKEDLAPLINELLALKVSFKEVTGTSILAELRSAI